VGQNAPGAALKQAAYYLLQAVAKVLLRPGGAGWCQLPFERALAPAII
jgi:hypothetical protein